MCLYSKIRKLCFIKNMFLMSFDSYSEQWIMKLWRNCENYIPRLKIYGISRCVFLSSIYVFFLNYLKWLPPFYWGQFIYRIHIFRMFMQNKYWCYVNNTFANVSNAYINICLKSTIKKVVWLVSIYFLRVYSKFSMLFLHRRLLQLLSTSNDLSNDL